MIICHRSNVIPTCQDSSLLSDLKAAPFGKEKECSGKNFPLSFASERFHIAAPATAVTVCIFDIWSDTEKKRNRCGVSVPLFYSPLSTPGKGGEKKQTAVNKVVIVSHCDIWRCDFLRELCCKAFPAEG